ncbi:helix-turn-helix domain-containing protein [Thermophagus sp. OGC60D27]|uniref:helix-turn-helix domain-containing protein n=1 Tax=Thermophagus sp. OGC60D27 TaxID=3458415 RepID=UPI00403780C2
MADKLDLMDLKQILTLYLDGIINRKIGEILGIHRNTINNYVHLFNSCKYSKEELVSLDNSELLKFIPIHTSIKNARYDELMRCFEKMNAQRGYSGNTAPPIPVILPPYSLIGSKRLMD